MKESKKQALRKALVAAGWGGHFAHESWSPNGVAMSAETWTDAKGSAGDYYDGAMYRTLFDDFGISLEINKIAEAHGCYCEWENPGVFGIYEM